MWRVGDVLAFGGTPRPTGLSNELRIGGRFMTLRRTRSTRTSRNLENSVELERLCHRSTVGGTRAVGCQATSEDLKGWSDMDETKLVTIERCGGWFASSTRMAGLSEYENTNPV